MLMICSYGDFYEVESLTKRLEIREGITEIGDSLFRGWEYIEYLSIPASMTYIGDYSFAYTDSLLEVTFAEGFSGDFHVIEAWPPDSPDGTYSGTFYQSQWLLQAVNNGYYGASFFSTMNGDFIDMTIGGKNWRFNHYYE